MFGSKKQNNSTKNGREEIKTYFLFKRSDRRYFKVKCEELKMYIVNPRATTLKKYVTYKQIVEIKWNY